MGAVGKGCWWVRRHLWHYLDRTLPAHQHEQVERHLEVCVPCRAQLAQAQQLLEALQQGRPVPESFQSLVPHKPRLASVGLGLILVMVIGSGLLLLQGHLQNLTQRSTTQLEASAVPLEPIQNEGKEAQSKPADSPADKSPTPPRSTIVVIPSAEPIRPPEPEPPAPQPMPALNRATTPKRSTAPAPSQQPSKDALPPAGTVEVYDAEGRLIKRQSIDELFSSGKPSNRSQEEKP